MVKYLDVVADTETGFATTVKHGQVVALPRARVWLIGWQLVHGDKRSPLLHSVLDFMNSLQKQARQRTVRVFFHNLKFDWSFFEDELYNAGYVFEELRNYDSNTLYQATLTYKGVNFIFYDTLKLYPSSLAALGQTLGLPKLVDAYDYDKLRRDVHDFAPQEIKYFWRDIAVLQQVMQMHFEQNKGQKMRLTRPSYAFADLRRMVKADDKQRHYKYEPCLFGKHMFQSKAQFDFIHASYYGGFTYANPATKEQLLGVGAVADCNSMYPSAMKMKYYPNVRTLRPMTKKQFRHWDWDDITNFAVVRVHFSKLQLKPGHFPSLPKKSHFGSSGAINSLDDLRVPFLTLTNIDIKWLFENYDVELDFLKGVWFRGKLTDPFKSFVDKHAQEKVAAGRRGDKVGRYLAKLSLNASYGKFGQSPLFVGCQVTYDDNNEHVAYLPNVEDVNPNTMRNVVVATFVTAYARNNLFTTIKACNDCPHLQFTYCDTDSVHFLIDKAWQHKSYPEIFAAIGVRCDDQALGAWKVEDEFVKAKYLREKVYIEVHPDGKFVVKMAGVDNQGKAEIVRRIHEDGWQTFTLLNGGLTVKCKRAHRIAGGTIIEDYDKTLTEKQIKRVLR